MSRRRRRTTGLALAFGMLGLEAAMVVGLRGARLSAGGRVAKAESRRMVSEKIEAALALQALALTGGLGATAPAAAAKALRHYRRKVRANRRRLSRR